MNREAFSPEQGAERSTPAFPRRICVLVNSLNRGGAERSLLMLAEELERRGLLGALVTLVGGTSTYAVPEHIAPLAINLNTRSILWAAWRLRSLTRSRNVNLVYSALPQANLVAVVWSAISGGYAVVSIRTVLGRVYRRRGLSKLAGWLKLSAILVSCRFAWKVVCISGEVRRDLLEQTRYLSDKTSVLWNPVDVPRDIVPTTPVQPGRYLLQSARHIRFVSVGRLVPSKGFEELVKTIVLMRPMQRVTLDIYGEGPLESALLGQIEKLHATDFIALRGFSSDLQKVFGGYDVFILNSSNEGFCRAFFESVLWGVPVLVPAHLAAVREVLGDLECFSPFDDCSPDSVINGLAALGGISTRDFAQARAALMVRLSLSRHGDSFLRIIEGR